MKPSVKVALICSLISIGISMIFFYNDNSIIGLEISPFINVFLLLTSIATGVFWFKKNEGFADKSFLEDIKMAMQGGIMFTILISGFVYIYYSKIDTSILEDRVNVRINNLRTEVPDNESYIIVQENDPITWEDKTYMDFIEIQEDAIKGANSATAFALVHAALGAFLTVFFSIFTTIILRKVVLR